MSVALSGNIGRVAVGVGKRNCVPLPVPNSDGLFYITGRKEGNFKQLDLLAIYKVKLVAGRLVDAPQEVRLYEFECWREEAWQMLLAGATEEEIISFEHTS